MNGKFLTPRALFPGVYLGGVSIAKHRFTERSLSSTRYRVLTTLSIGRARRSPRISVRTRQRICRVLSWRNGVQ